MAMGMECNVPPWLERLVAITTFFSACEVHTEEPKNECNMYCLDCGDKALCFYCVSSCQKDHRQIQIRRSSYHNVVKASDVHEYLNISGVQNYVINSSKVLFLNKRDFYLPKTQKTGRGYKRSRQCKICKRNLVDPYRFCSLGCKLEWVKDGGSGSCVPSTKKEEETGKRKNEETGKRKNEEISRNLVSKEEDNVEKHSPYAKPNPKASSNSKRRKGIPRRAPFY